MAVTALFSGSFLWVLSMLGPVWRQEGWEEPAAPAGSAVGLLGWAVGVQGAPSPSRFIFPQTPSVLAVFSVPFGWTIFPVGPCHKGCVRARWLSAVGIPIPVSTENRRRVFLGPQKSQDQLGPVSEQ